MREKKKYYAFIAAYQNYDMLDVWLHWIKHDHILFSVIIADYLNGTRKYDFNGKLPFEQQPQQQQKKNKNEDNRKKKHSNTN